MRLNSDGIRQYSETARRQPWSVLLCLVIAAVMPVGCASHRHGSADTRAGGAVRVAEAMVIDQSLLAMIHQVKTDIVRVTGVEAILLLLPEQAPNAYAWSDQNEHYIGISIGLVELIGSEADQYAFVLAHEIAHLARDHVVERQAREASVGRKADAVIAAMDIVGLLAGVPLGFVSALSTDSTTHLMALKHTRDQEREADRLGLRYMMDAGYAPQAAVVFQEKLLAAAGERLLPFLSTHPSGQERIAEMRAMVAAVNRNDK